tara:strand:+ start:10722 stop:12575 length:1854 start_codon:yes stop_codon:yes gene_type:complete
MAKNAKLDMTVDVVNNTEAGLVEVEKSVDRTAKSMQKAGKKTSKDWGGVGDLFSSLLPRGMQKTIRSFKSTGRSVGRLSKSFKVLKAAWASVGIGLAILAVEALIENWDKLSEALGYTNPALEEQKKLQEELTLAQNNTTLSVKGALEAVADLTTSDEERATALEIINRELGTYVDAQADANTQSQQAKDILAAKLELDEAQRIESIKTEELAQKRIDAENELLEISKTMFGSGEAREKARVEKELLDLTNEQNAAQERLITATTSYNALITEGTVREKDRSKAEADITKTKTESDRKREANAKYLAQLEKTLSEEIMLAGIEDEEERQLKVLELRNEEQRQKAEDAGATTLQLLQIEQAYQMEREAVIKSFSDRQKEEAEADRQQAVADEIALEDELFMVSMDAEDRELTALQQKYEKQIALAGDRDDLILQATEQFQTQYSAVQSKYEQERLDESQRVTDDDVKIKQAGAKAVISATRNLFGTMEALAGENEKAAQGFAITGVLLAQAVALANGIKTATQSSATVWDMIAGIVASTAAVLGAFVGVKAILNEATGGGGGDVGGGVSATMPLVPTGVARTDTIDTGSNQAYVVQTELEGANMVANNIYGQTSLNPG